MIGLITTALRQAWDALDQEDDAGYAFHCGEAGGIAAATAAFGVRALELCDDLSDAYEDIDLDFMWYILRETSERPDGIEEDHARTRETNLHALEFGAAFAGGDKGEGRGRPVKVLPDDRVHGRVDVPLPSSGRWCGRRRTRQDSGRLSR